MLQLNDEKHAFLALIRQRRGDTKTYNRAIPTTAYARVLGWHLRQATQHHEERDLLIRLAGADLGWSRGQSVSSTLRPREGCWSMQRRHGVPESLKPTETSRNVSRSRSCRECSEVHPQKQSCRRRDWRQSPTGMTPQLYACMIDGGGCQGRLQERGCREEGEAEDE